MERNVTEKKAGSGRFSYPVGKFGCYTSKYILMKYRRQRRSLAKPNSRYACRSKFQKYLTALLILGVIFLNIKKVFMDFSVDVEYAITMFYRLAMGDHMFSQMWEPHQTSAFLLAFFIKIWMSALGTTTGLVIYLNTVSLLVKSTVTLFFYKPLKTTYGEKLLRYWEQNPDKFPDVVVVDCWFGNLNVDENSWIMQWIYEEFGADSYEDGTYQRYYRRQKNDTQIQ